MNSDIQKGTWLSLSISDGNGARRATTAKVLERTEMPHNEVELRVRGFTGDSDEDAKVFRGSEGEVFFRDSSDAVWSVEDYKRVDNPFAFSLKSVAQR